MERDFLMNYFDRPYLLFLIIPILVYAVLYYYFKIYNTKQTLSLSHQNSTDKERFTILDLFPFLKFIIATLLVFAIAGPGQKTEFLPDEKNGIDIMIAIDVSGSMARSNDFLPSNRLEVSKKLIKDFIKKRVNDRLGLVVFGGAAYLQSPLTSDKESLIEILDDINEASVREQGTAIGDAIALSTYRLKRSKAKSKVMVIITDGVSNTGKIDPFTAMETSKHFGVKIYSIGVGKTSFGISQVDFDSLKKISDSTGGLFYRATDTNQFQKILDSIDRLEKDKLETKPIVFSFSKYEIFLYPAIFLFMVDLLLRTFVWRYFV